MLRVFVFIIYIVAILLVPHNGWAEEKDCSCPKVTCGPCQKKVTIGKEVKFCDWGDINVCRKVVCENVNFYFGCLSNYNKERAPEGEAKGDLELVYDLGEKDQETVNGKREPASKVALKKGTGAVVLQAQGKIEVGNDSRVLPGENYSEVVIGEVAGFDSGLQILHRGRIHPVQKGQKLYVDDEIVNKQKKNKNLDITFKSGRVKLNLFAKSKLVVQDPNSIAGRFQPFLYLVHGGLTFDVTMKQGSFDLLAGQILTRAASGKHQVGYEMGQQGLQVKVESFAESIDVIRAQDLSGKIIQVKAGNFVTWMSETSKALFSMDEKQALASEGFITPVFQMPEARRQKLGLVPTKKTSLFADWSSEPPSLERSERGLASVSTGDLCQSPSAGFQQCAWSCEGNGKGAKGCMAEKESVHCVRRVCNAAGQWGNPTAFATSYKDLCPSDGVRVGDCSP